MTQQISVQTPFGWLTLTQNDDAITRVTWGKVVKSDSTPLLDRARAQLRAYCDGDLTRFDLPMRVAGSSLQKRVCAAMAEIPFGETRTYGEIAEQVGASPQAVGQACGGNPLPILIPCHRVMGADGKLVGFSGAGGVETKVALLRHENAASFLL